MAVAPRDILPHLFDARYHDKLWRHLLDHLVHYEALRAGSDSVHSITVDLTHAEYAQRASLWYVHGTLPSTRALNRFLRVRQVSRAWRDWFDWSAPRLLSSGTLCFSQSMAPFERNAPVPLCAWPRALQRMIRTSEHCLGVSVVYWAHGRQVAWHVAPGERKPQSRRGRLKRLIWRIFHPFE